MTCSSHSLALYSSHASPRCSRGTRGTTCRPFDWRVVFLLSWSNFCIFVLDTRHLLRSMQAFLFEGADLPPVPSARRFLSPISFCQNLLLKGFDQKLCSERLNSGERSRFSVKMYLENCGSRLTRRDRELKPPPVRTPGASAYKTSIPTSRVE